MDVSCIKYPTEQDWFACKERALLTVGLKPKVEPTFEWKCAILEARHSPIRYLQFSFFLKDIPYFVSDHLCRHVHAQPYVQSQRNDRQDKYDRNTAPQNYPVNMIWDMNAEELMVIANKRLCNKASEETRFVVNKMCQQVIKTNPEFKEFLVPACKYYGKCKEMISCKNLNLDAR